MAKIALFALFSYAVAFTSAKVDCNLMEQLGRFQHNEIDWTDLLPRLLGNEVAGSCYAECQLKRIKVLVDGKIDVSVLKNTEEEIDERLDNAAAKCQIAGATGSGSCGEGREAAKCLYDALDKVGDKYDSEKGVGAAIRKLLNSSE